MCSGQAFGGVDSPLREQDAAVACGELAALPLLEVLIVVQPRIQILAKAVLDQTADAAVDGLHLVGLVGRVPSTRRRLSSERGGETAGTRVSAPRPGP